MDYWLIQTAPDVFYIAYGLILIVVVIVVRAYGFC